MYSINGVPLHEGHTGWRILRDGTNTQGGITNALSKVPMPGRPGYNPAPYTFTEQVVILIVRTPRNRLDALLALCGDARVLTRTDDPTKTARIELASALPSGDAPFDGVFDVTITLSLYDGVWRDAEATIFGAAGITSPTQQFQLLVGQSAPIHDADVFIRGIFGEFTLRDSGGSWLKTIRAIPGQTAARGLFWSGSSGQAFIANESAPWTPISDASQYVDVSGNGGFRLTPLLVDGNPNNRRVDLTLTTLSQTSTTLRVRAKRAYRMN